MCLCVKVVAFGARAYASDGWCQLDALTVGLPRALLLFPGLGRLYLIRALRGLRPLRALRRVTGMPALVQAIIESLPKVYNVIALCTHDQGSNSPV